MLNGEPSKQEAVDAFEQKALSEELAALVQWAKYRVALAELDDDLDSLLAEKVGKLTKRQIQTIQAQKIIVPFGSPPALFIQIRGTLMLLTDEEMKRLFAPDMLADDEALMLIWAMHDIITWLQQQEETPQMFSHVLAAYQDFLNRARQTYMLVSQHSPHVERILSQVMRLHDAQSILKAQGEEA